MVQRLFCLSQEVLSYNVQPAIIRRSYQREGIGRREGPPTDGWKITATFRGGIEGEHVLYAMMSRHGSLEIAESADSREQPFVYGPNPVYDTRYWMSRSIYPLQWQRFLSECQIEYQFESCAVSSFPVTKN
jgi:hypothetical protein